MTQNLLSVSFVCVCMALSGCVGDEGPNIIVTAPKIIPVKHLSDIIPLSTLKCLKRPDGSQVKSIRQSATYIVDLDRAGQDCRRKLATVGAMIRNEK